MADDGGVLGNLPNSRPGKRSEKRGSGDGVYVDRAMRGERIHGPVPPSPADDPVGAVVRAGTSVAVTGVKVSAALMREVFHRLPRP